MNGHMTDREMDQAIATTTAVRLWAGFTKDEKNLVRFGMFPAEKMRAAEAEIGSDKDTVRLLAVALMDCAKRDGGMVA
jgi:hypothetical protein